MCALVKGPLHSDSASGKVAGSIVMSHWKGRPYCRQLVTPMNKKSDGQAETRLYMASCGKNDKMIQNLAPGKTVPGVLFTQITAVTPSDQSWHSYFQKTQIGMALANIIAARAAWALLSPTNQGYYNTTAAGIPLTGFDIGYGIVAPITGGEQLFISATAGFALGLAICPVSASTMSQAQITALGAAYKATT